MPSEARALRKRLRDTGLSSSAITAVWPTWWSDEAEASRSAIVELRYTVARRLGLSPRSLFDDGSPEFLWRGAGKFKNVGTRSEDELTILTSFGVAVGESLLSAIPETGLDLPDAQQLRTALLSNAPVVDLWGLLGTAWALGTPVVHQGLFPLGPKRMHALTVRIGDRYAILIGQSSVYPAQIAYTLAHELGHIARRHLRDRAALLDADDPIRSDDDEEEREANAYALELLTGDPRTVVEASEEEFSARQLATAALQAADSLQVDPGVLALCLGHSSGRWRQAFGALKIMSPPQEDVGRLMNDLARHELKWAEIPDDTREFLDAAMGFDASPA